MKFIYPAVFHKNDEGKYEGYFPDLACCTSIGDTLDEAIEEANYAANEWISSELAEDDCDLPPVSDINDLTLKEGDIARLIAVNIKFYDGWDE